MKIIFINYDSYYPYDKSWSEAFLTDFQLGWTRDEDISYSTLNNNIIVLLSPLEKIYKILYPIRSGIKKIYESIIKAEVKRLVNLNESFWQLLDLDPIAPTGIAPTGIKYIQEHMYESTIQYGFTTPGTIFSCSKSTRKALKTLKTLGWVDTGNQTNHMYSYGITYKHV